MALLGAFLGKIDVFDAEPRLLEELRVGEKDEVCCPRESCISRTEIRHADAKFKIISRVPLQVACAYCSNEIAVGAVGCRTTKQWHVPTSPQLKKIRPEEMAFFVDPEAAVANGFQPGPEMNEAPKEPAPPVL